MAYYFSYSAKSLSKILRENLSSELYSKLYNKNKLHCTMLYSNENFKEEYQNLKLPDIKVKIHNIELWQTEYDFVVVAKIDSQYLQNLHDKIKETFNIEYARQAFNPHITLKKIKEESEFLNQEEMKSLEFLQGIPITLEKFEVKKVLPKNKLKM